MGTRLSRLILAFAAINLCALKVTVAAPSIEGIWDPVFAAGLGHPQPENVSLTQEGRAEYQSFSKDKDPTLKCIMPGVPLGIYDPYPLEIVEQAHQITFLHEHFHMVRRIFMDGREAPNDWWPSLSGFSVGHWEENTLVVTTTHLSPDNIMWHNGMPFSGDSDSYTIERYSFDGDEMNLSAEIFDPRYYAEPYQIVARRSRTADGMIFEYECYAEYSGAELEDGS
jgi:hypothetical protein